MPARITSMSTYMQAANAEGGHHKLGHQKTLSNNRASSFATHRSSSRNGSKSLGGENSNDADQAVDVKRIFVSRGSTRLPDPVQTPDQETPCPKSFAATAQLNAAARIARFWKKKTRGPALHRKNLMDRLMLEDALCTGLFRLIVFILTFLLILMSNSYGTPSSERLAISSMLDQTLDIEAFEQIAGLEDARNFLPQLSENIKVYSASSSKLYPDPESMRIISSETRFTSPLSMDLQQLPVIRSEFTLSAWVRVDSAVQPGQSFSLIRKPLSTNRVVSCWGWFHPAQFRFGANDFHSLAELDAWEERVEAGAEVPPGLSHEALVVANGTAQFYRNGQRLGEGVALPRAITDCDGTIQLGEAGLAMSAVKVYARALLASQILEMFESGQPLFEIATGSTLSDAQRDRFGEVEFALGTTAESLERAVDRLDQARAVAEAAGRTSVEGDAEALADVVFPEDHSPPSVLPEPTPASALPEGGRAEWEAQGGHRDLGRSKTGRWVDAAEEEGGRFWSVIGDAPVHAHYPAVADSAGIPKAQSLGQLPRFEERTRHMTFAFWLKAVAPYKQFSTVFEFDGYEGLSEEEIARKNSDPEWEGRFAEFHVMAFGNACQLWSGKERFIQPVADFVMGKPETGPMDERFFVVRDVGELLPVPWRFYVFHFDLENGFFEGYWDGFLSTRREIGSFSKSADDIFSELWVNLRTRTWWNNDESLGKVADLRVYPRQLSVDQMQAIHTSSTWPDGFPKKQCASKGDPDFFDSGDPRGGVSWPVTQDAEGRDCAWYAMMVEASPHVCSSAAAKNMCPMTCKKVRECHMGTAFRDPAAAAAAAAADDDDTAAPEPTAAGGRVYRMFDRIMHLKPDYTAGASSVICPAKGVDVAAEVAKCRADPEAAYPPNAVYEHFEEVLKLSWWGQKRADIRDCDVLERTVDYGQCAWDDSWLPDFRKDFEANGGQFSVMFWAHSTPQSEGMPDQFWLSLNLFVKLSTPQTLLSVYPPNPYEESIMRMNFSPDKARTEATNRFKADLKPIKSVRFERDWVLYYFSAEPQDNPDAPMRYCVGVNALVNCRDGIRFVHPEEFLAAVEFTREAMVSPLEFRPYALSKAQVQRMFYAKAPKMALIPGPNMNEKDRRAATSAPTPKEPGDFDEQILLAAPPLLFQQRAGLEQCKPEAMQGFFEAQHNLVLAAHCSIPGQCDAVSGPEEWYLCKSDKLIGRGDDVKHYGLVPSTLDSKDGFTDFLYTMADSEVIVREGRVLPAREFLDGQTQEAVVLCLLHVPEMGETVVAELRMEVVGVRVETSREYTFYGFLGAEQRKQAALAFGFLFAMCFIGILGNLYLGKRLRDYIKGWLLPGFRGYKTEVAEVVADVLLLLLVMAFSAFSLRSHLDSESRAGEVIERFAAVPFADAGVSGEDKVAAFFVAMDKLKANLQEERVTANCAFVLMIAMLVRIILATAVHPRTAVLIGTIMHGLGDLWHFAIMFLIVFFFFALTATWMFSASFEDFADIHQACLTQFYVLLGELPDDFSDDARLVIYISISVMVQFFLMLNFLLAIVVEGYMKVREDIEANETEKEVTTDIVLTVYNRALGLYYGWPEPMEVVLLLKNKVLARSVSKQELGQAGVSAAAAKGFTLRYFQQRALRAEVVDKYDLNYIFRSFAPSGDLASQLSSESFRSQPVPPSPAQNRPQRNGSSSPHRTASRGAGPPPPRNRVPSGVISFPLPKADSRRQSCESGRWEEGSPASEAGPIEQLERTVEAMIDERVETIAEAVAARVLARMGGASKGPWGFEEGPRLTEAARDLLVCAEMPPAGKGAWGGGEGARGGGGERADDGVGALQEGEDCPADSASASHRSGPQPPEHAEEAAPRAGPGDAMDLHLHPRESEGPGAVSFILNNPVAASPRIAEWPQQTQPPRSRDLWTQTPVAAWGGGDRRHEGVNVEVSGAPPAARVPVVQGTFPEVQASLEWQPVTQWQTQT